MFYTLILICLQLLEKDSSKRLGNRYCPAGDIKEQPFFHQIDWDKLERRQLEAPFKPKVVSIYILSLNKYYYF